MKDKGQESFFPFEFSVREIAHGVDFNSFVYGVSGSSQKTQLDVLSDNVKKVEAILTKMFSLYLRTKTPEQMAAVSNWSEADMRAWFDSLENKDQVDAFKKLCDDLISVYKTFETDLMDPGLERNLPIKDNLNYYEAGRMFGYVVDKALTRLPWGIMTKFSMDVVDESRDLSLGQKPAFIGYMYNNTISPFAIITPDLVNGSLAELQGNDGREQKFGGKPKMDFDDEIRAYKNQMIQQSRGFGHSCELIFQ
jgi:hypothetical protein